MKIWPFEIAGDAICRSPRSFLASTNDLYRIQPFDWREIPGAEIAKDFWIAGIEAVKG